MAWSWGELVFTVYDRGVDHNAGQVGVGHGFIQDQPSDAEMGKNPEC